MLSNRHSFTLIILILLFALALPAMAAKRKRSSRDVRREKQRTEQQIAATRKKINMNDREIGRQLDRLNLLGAEMKLRSDTISIIRARLDSVNSRIKTLNDSIASLTAHEKILKANYAKTLRDIRSRRQGMSDIAFIFSAESFAQAWRRIRYMREVNKASTRQAASLRRTAETLKATTASLDTLRVAHAASLAQLSKTQTALSNQRNDADRLVRNLRAQGRSLNRELDRRRTQAQALDRELNRLIEQEIREAEARRQAEEKARREAEEKRLAEEKARKEAADKAQAQAPSDKSDRSDKSEKSVAATPKKPKPTYSSQAEADRILTGSFESNKGRLLFPVAGRYTITSNFGTYDHPDLAKVKMTNLGIDIEVPKGTSTRAVFDGVVSSIFRIDGYNNVVILRHGEYLTVYAGINALSVKKGDKVKVGQTLGSLYTDPDGGSTKLHFEIRREKQKLNPTEWVK